jgi:hypothetical protein
MTMLSDQVRGGATDRINLNGLSLQRLFTIRASQDRLKGPPAVLVGNSIRLVSAVESGDALG